MGTPTEMAAAGWGRAHSIARCGLRRAGIAAACSTPASSSSSSSSRRSANNSVNTNALDAYRESLKRMGIEGEVADAFLLRANADEDLAVTANLHTHTLYSEGWKK